MFDPKQLLEQMLSGGDLESIGRQMRNRLDEAGGAQSFAGGAVAGGLLGLLLGGRRARRRRGGVLGYGGAAVVGALAMRAYQAYQAQQAGRAEAPSSGFGDVLPHAVPAADGGPFELVLVQAMIGAAKADGHIDADEKRRLFAEVERMGLDPEAKAFVFDLLTNDIDIGSLARAVATSEQGAELYLAARLAIDIDEPAERAYLDALAARLKLPAELRARLDDAPAG